MKHKTWELTKHSPQERRWTLFSESNRAV